MAQPQPIIHPPHPPASGQGDHPMPSPSYSSFNQAFGQAAYTRAFFGSPISWRPGSFGSGNRYDREDELCRNYTCCGLNLQDLHDLVEHFEECHVVVDDPSQLIPGQPYPPNYAVSPANPKFDSYIPHSAHVPRPQEHHQHLQHPQQHQQGPFDPDDLELDMDLSPASSSASSPPITPVTTSLVPHTTQQVFANASSFTPLALSQPSSECPSPVSAFDTATVLPSRSSTSMSAFSQTQHNSFSTYSADYRTVTSPLQASQEITCASGSQLGSPYSFVPPTILSSPSFITPTNTPSSSRVASPVATQGETQSSYHSISGQAFCPTPSLRLSEPFCCPKPNCNKSYKQAKGLKHHMTRGYCNFASPKDLKAPQAFLAERGDVADGDDPSGVQILEGELDEAGRETECRLRPLACGIGYCQRRYKNLNGLRYHYQHSGDHGAIGLQLLASGKHECLQRSKSAAATCQSTSAHSAATSESPLTYPSCPSPSKSTGSHSWHYSQSFGQSRYLPSDAVNSWHSLTPEHVPASLPEGKLLSDHVRELYPQRVNAISSPTQEHVPASQFFRSRMLIPPETLHPTLYSWIKNINKLSRLVGRLQELASSAPAEHQSQLLAHVVTLRTTSKKQQQCCMEFLTLSEEYANKYLLDISAEIQRQSSFLDTLEERLEAARKLRREAVDLKMLYESGTAATMENFRATALSRPLSEDHALFSEVDLVLSEIRQCYMKLDKFWTEEISCVVEALETRRVDPTDFERWKNFQTDLKRTIESWKNKLPSGDPQTVHCNNARSSKESDIGVITSSLSSAMGSLTSALERLPSTNSLKYSQSGQSSIQRAYVSFAANSDMCLSFLRQCADYGEKVIGWGLPSITLSTALASHDLWERTTRLQSEMKGIFVENAASVQGSRKFKATYDEALSLERKTASGLNTLLEELSSWVLVTDNHGLPADVLPDEPTLEQVRELSYVWAKARDSMHTALLTLTSKPAPRLSYRSALLASTRPRSVVRRWVMDLVRIP